MKTTEEMKEIWKEIFEWVFYQSLDNRAKQVYALAEETEVTFIYLNHLGN